MDIKTSWLFSIPTGIVKFLTTGTSFHLSREKVSFSLALQTFYLEGKQKKRRRTRRRGRGRRWERKGKGEKWNMNDREKREKREK